jgi:acetylornithine/succinyldiaminopimelate/putrescine aminotransferase
MVGVSLGNGRDAADVGRRALEAGLVINVPGEGMLRFLPPLIVEAADVDRAVEVVGDCI